MAWTGDLHGVFPYLVSPLDQDGKVDRAVLVALVLFPMVQPLLPTVNGAIAGPGLIALLFGEILIGLVLGLSVRMVLAALQTAGNVISQQLGLSYAMTVDPTMGGQQASLGNFLTLLGITLILASDLHHLALDAIGRSYQLLPGPDRHADPARIARRRDGRLHRRSRALPRRFPRPLTRAGGR